MKFALSDKMLVALLALAVLVLLAGRLASAGDTAMTIWGDRDLWRALAVPEHWPLSGPESNGGTRAVGGAFYLLLAALLALGHSVIAVNLAVVLLFAASVLLIGLFFAREVSPLAGALIAATLAGSVILAQTMGVWNPGFILIFATLATLCGYRFLASGRALPLGMAVASIAIGMQIHLQITQVAVGLALATAFYRPRLTRYHALAVLLGIAIPYLPNILSGSARMLQTAAALPGDAVANYVFWEVDRLAQKAGIFADLFGGGAHVFGDQGLWPRPLLALADVMELVLAGAGAIAMGWRRRVLFGARPVALFPLILLVTVVTALASDLLARHMVAVAPAAAILVGLTAERLVVALGRQCPAGAVIGAAVCLLIALRPLAFGITGFADQPFQPGSVAAEAEIAAAIKPTLYADRDAFEAHAAQFRRTESRRWMVVSNGIPNHMSFLYQTLPVAASGGNRDECLAIIAKTDADADLRKGLAASPSLAGLGAVIGEPVAESAHFLYVAYTTRDGNCLKTFPNGYIPTAFEAAHLPVNSPAAASSQPDSAIFAVPQAGHPSPTGIEIRREAGGYVAVLHGSLLRGYTGLYFRSIVAPSLCFVGEQGPQMVRFANVTIGSPQRGTLAPWRSPVFQLADGSYRLWLIGADGRQPISIRDSVGELSLPTLEATAHTTADPPPAGCR